MAQNALSSVLASLLCLAGFEARAGNDACAPLHIGAALVKNGTFVLPVAPNSIVDGQLTRSIIDYLPASALVALPSERLEPVQNAQYISENYRQVLSDTGVKGLVRCTEIEPLLPGDWLIAVGDQDIVILQPAKEEKRSSFSKRSGRYVRVIAEPKSGESSYVVSLPWTAADAASEDRGRLDIRWVASGKVKRVNPSDVAKMINSAPTIARQITAGEEAADVVEDVVAEGYSWLAKKLVPGDVAKAKSYLTEVALNPCTAELKASASIGSTFLGTGLKMEAGLSLKQQGMRYFLEAFSQRAFETKFGPVMVGLRRVACNGNNIERLQEYIVEGEGMEGVIISLDHLPPGVKTGWDAGLKSEEFRKKMVRISGYTSYQALHDFLQRQASEGSWLARLNEAERRTFIAFMVRELAYFDSSH